MLPTEKYLIAIYMQTIQNHPWLKTVFITNKNKIGALHNLTNLKEFLN